MLVFSNYLYSILRYSFYFIFQNEEPEPRCLCDGHGSGSRVSCDQCDEDFHCLCVGITEAMRERLERKNAEWFCPRCNHKECPMMHKAKLMQVCKTTNLMKVFNAYLTFICLFRWCK